MRSKCLLFLAALGLAGCGDDDRGGGEPGPADACRDVVGALVDKCVACGATRSSCDEAIGGALGPCDEVVSIRDRDELYADCIPWMRALPCAEWEDPYFSLPVECEEQLEYE